MKNEFKKDAGTIISGVDARAATTTTVAVASTPTTSGACHRHS
jgi:hypothetical protein